MKRDAKTAKKIAETYLEIFEPDGTPRPAGAGHRGDHRSAEAARPAGDQDGRAGPGWTAAHRAPSAVGRATAAPGPAGPPAPDSPRPARAAAIMSVVDRPSR